MMTKREFALGVAAAFGCAWPAEADEARVRWTADILDQPPAWRRSDQARRMADNVLTHQSPEGGWPKNTDLGQPASTDANPGLANTFDNHATTLPIAFLAQMSNATGERRYAEAINRGLNYVLAAQYPNGGWPQFYPLRGGYYDHITFNDDAMVRVMRLLRDVAAGKEPFASIDTERQTRARDAVARGLALILDTQVRQQGRLTAWCAQYDERTLKPAWARRFEPPSLSGSESVGIVRFLMDSPPTPEVVAAVEGAVAWFEQVALRDVRLESFTAADGQPDRRLVATPGAERLWARFYDLETNRPIYMGREAVVRENLADIERERRAGYAYVGAWPLTLLQTTYPRWRAARPG